MKVYLAWYHDGFTDNASVLLAVCDTYALAKSVTEGHKLARNKDAEYRDKATWYIDDEEVRTAAIDGEGGGK